MVVRSMPASRSQKLSVPNTSSKGTLPTAFALGARRSPTSRDPGRRDHDVGLRHVSGQIAGSGVAQRDGGILAAPGQQEAEGVGPP